MDNMDTNQQPQTPPSVVSPAPQPVNPVPPVMQQQMTHKKSNWFWIMVGALIAFGGFAWWYVGQMSEEPVIIEQLPIDHEAREDIMIKSEIDEADLGDLNEEFMEIDKDLESL